MDADFYRLQRERESSGANLRIDMAFVFGSLNQTQCVGKRVIEIFRQARLSVSIGLVAAEYLGEIVSPRAGFHQTCSPQQQEVGQGPVVIHSSTTSSEKRKRITLAIVIVHYISSPYIPCTVETHPPATL
ncbi:hypothetical protein [Candidatus Poriferisocius sp.]|uniref:hypothetical protein n=1 Tax=Candidatus Poriferisocius sp. TaxID=3101276 RepID=UPI003B012747